MSDHFLQLIDPGAKKLLAIAAVNDKANRLFDNTALTNGLQALSRLHELSFKEETDSIIEWLRLPKQEEKTFFIQLTAAFLRAIQPNAYKDASVNGSDYDHFVLMAAAETLSEIMWQDKRESDISGPVLKECLEEYGFQELGIILQVFTKNYIGNILQYLFEAAKIRVINPNLAPETETELKEVDAVAISSYVFFGLSIDSYAESNAKKVIEKLNLAYKLILTK